MSLFLPIFEALNGANIRYIAVGGIAVVLHGFPRITGDIDLVLDLAPENALSAIGLLESMDFKPRAPVKASDFANAATREK